MFRRGLAHSRVSWTILAHVGPSLNWWKLEGVPLLAHLVVGNIVRVVVAAINVTTFSEAMFNERVVQCFVVACGKWTSKYFRFSRVYERGLFITIVPVSSKSLHICDCVRG